MGQWSAWSVLFFQCYRWTTLTYPKPPHFGQRSRFGLWIYPLPLKHGQTAMPYFSGWKISMPISYTEAGVLFPFFPFLFIHQSIRLRQKLIYWNGGVRIKLSRTHTHQSLFSLNIGQDILSWPRQEGSDNALRPLWSTQSHPFRAQKSLDRLFSDTHLFKTTSFFWQCFSFLPTFIFYCITSFLWWLRINRF